MTLSEMDGELRAMIRVRPDLLVKNEELYAVCLRAHAAAKEEYLHYRTDYDTYRAATAASYEAYYNAVKALSA